ncbi:ATP-binding protein [Motilibacter aurantiacus]|uniref:ATP-binding protein n=1 Tax=Motilibacter aurantiacus TaxID=2714955 RepID=UPI002F2B87BB
MSSSEVSLRFLDEAPEFSPAVLDALRQPLESGLVVLSRAGGTARYPARTTLVLAANPCPCGRAVGKGLDCTCTPLARRRYLSRLSGPLLDRVDLRVEVLPPVGAQRLGALEPGGAEPTAVVAARVAEARARAAARFQGLAWRTNAEVPGRELRARWRVRDARAVEEAVLRGVLTLRGADRALRVSWTLADLGGRQQPSAADVALAVGLRLSATGAAA